MADFSKLKEMWSKVKDYHDENVKESREKDPEMSGKFDDMNAAMMYNMLKKQGMDPEEAKDQAMESSQEIPAMDEGSFMMGGVSGKAAKSARSLGKLTGSWRGGPPASASAQRAKIPTNDLDPSKFVASPKYKFKDLGELPEEFAGEFPITREPMHKYIKELNHVEEPTQIVPNRKEILMNFLRKLKKGN